MSNEMTFSGIFRELLALLGRAWREVVLYTFVVGGTMTAGMLAGISDPSSTRFNFGFQINQNDTPASAAFEILTGIVSIVATYFLLKRCLAASGRLRTRSNRFWPYLGMAILSGLATALGLVLLIVPGIILLVRWTGASGYVIGAGQGVVEGLTSSWHATKGHSWAIFFAGIVLFLALIAATAVVGGVAGFVSPAVGDPVSAFLESAYNAIFSAFGIAIYCLGQDDTQELREVFA